MMRLATIARGYGSWLDTVSETAASSLVGMSSPRTITLVENENGELVLREEQPIADCRLQCGQLQIADDRIIESSISHEVLVLSGWHVELVLRSERFLLRPLELPARAAEFLDGVVRAQIDRLTPWSAEEATFGWSEPVRQDDGRINVTVAAAPRESISQYVKDIADLGASSIAIFTEISQDGDDVVSIRLLDERPHKSPDANRIRRALSITISVAFLVASLCLGATVVVGGYVSTQQEDIARNIGDARAGLAADGKPTFALQRVLERRKHEVTPVVMVLETLSQILPDDTFITSLQIDGDKVRIMGVARDAPGLIALMERSNRLARATFFAPTTRSPSDQGERFHIEAQIQPVAPSSSL